MENSNAAPNRPTSTGARRARSRNCHQPLERVADERAQHVKRAVGEIHDAHQAEDQRQADPEEEQQGGLRQPV